MLDPTAKLDIKKYVTEIRNSFINPELEKGFTYKVAREIYNKLTTHKISRATEYGGAPHFV